MQRKKLIILPQLYDAGGNVSKQWFVYYSVRNTLTDKMVRFKDYAGLADKDSEKRYVVARQMIQELTDKLKAGWTPFTDDSKAIYEDQLQYRSIAQIYGTRKAQNATFRFYASKYIEHLLATSPDLADSTLKSYKSKLRLFSEWIQAKYGDIDIRAIDNKIILSFFDFITKTKKLARGTVNDYRQIISAVFDYAIKQKIIKEQPVYNTPSGVEKDRAPRPVAVFDIETFRTTISEKDPQLWMAIEFETYCFLRPGQELRLLKIKDIDFARGLINVDRSRAKTNRERYATIPIHFLKKLRELYQLHTYNREWYVFGREFMPGTEVLGKNNLKNRFNRFRELLNMPDCYKLYSWKHTGNALATDTDINMFALRDQNGHSSIQTTEIYIKNKFGKVSKDIREKFPNLEDY